MTPPRHSVMWAGNVRGLPYAERLRCTVRAGFNSMSLSPLDYQRFTAVGLSAVEMVKMAEDRGVRIVTLDPIANWTDEWHGDGIPEAALPFVATPRDEFFAIAERLRVESITAMCTAFAQNMPRDKIRDGFARLCVQAAQHGMRVGIEFMPMWAVSDLAAAWDLVQSVGLPNAGIVFDFWHFMRGNPDWELLAAIPGAKIFHAQFTDAAAILPSDRSLNEDCLFHRMELGTGGLPIGRLTHALASIDGLASVGSEIFSLTFDSLGADDIADRSGPPLATLLREVNLGLPTQP